MKENPFNNLNKAPPDEFAIFWIDGQVWEDHATRIDDDGVIRLHRIELFLLGLIIFVVGFWFVVELDSIPQFCHAFLHWKNERIFKFIVELRDSFFNLNKSSTQSQICQTRFYYEKYEELSLFK